MESQVLSILIQFPVAGLVALVSRFAFRELKEQRKEFTLALKEQRKEFTLALKEQRTEFIGALGEQKAVDKEAIQIVRELQMTQARLVERITPP